VRIERHGRLRRVARLGPALFAERAQRALREKAAFGTNRISAGRVPGCGDLYHRRILGHRVVPGRKHEHPSARRRPALLESAHGLRNGGPAGRVVEHHLVTRRRDDHEVMEKTRGAVHQDDHGATLPQRPAQGRAIAE
jgi:hypothetical protein